MNQRPVEFLTQFSAMNHQRNYVIRTRITSRIRIKATVAQSCLGYLCPAFYDPGIRLQGITSSTALEYIGNIQ